MNAQAYLLYVLTDDAGSVVNETRSPLTDAQAASLSFAPRAGGVSRPTPTPVHQHGEDGPLTPRLEPPFVTDPDEDGDVGDALTPLPIPRLPPVALYEDDPQVLEMFKGEFASHRAPPPKVADVPEFRPPHRADAPHRVASAPAPAIAAPPKVPAKPRRKSRAA